MKTIPLTQGYFTKVDNEDYEKFASIRWHAAFGADSKPKNNTSGYKGVCWNKMAHKWQVNICKDCKRYYFGLHKSKKKAARVYDDAAIKMFGEFAKLNFPKRKSPDN